MEGRGDAEGLGELEHEARRTAADGVGRGARQELAADEGEERLGGDVRLVLLAHRSEGAGDERGLVRARERLVGPHGHGGGAVLIDDEQQDAVGVLDAPLGERPLDMLLGPRHELRRDGPAVHDAAREGADMAVPEQERPRRETPAADERRRSQREALHLVMARVGHVPSCVREPPPCAKLHASVRHGGRAWIPAQRRETQR